MIHIDVWVYDGFQLKLGPQDNARETESANSCPEKLTIFVRGTGEAFTIGAQQFETCDMAAKGTSPVVVFAMNVIGDGPTNRYKFGTRRDRQKPAARNHDREDFCQRHTSFTAQQPLTLIKRHEALQVADIDGDTAFVEAAITIAASVGIRENRFVKRCQVRQLVAPVNGLDLARFDFRIAPPRLGLPGFFRR